MRPRPRRLDAAQGDRQVGLTAGLDRAGGAGSRRWADPGAALVSMAIVIALVILAEHGQDVAGGRRELS